MTITAVMFLSNFNPRTREGCDNVLLTAFVRYPLFQSTHPRGVRRLLLLNSYFGS